MRPTPREKENLSLLFPCDLLLLPLFTILACSTSQTSILPQFVQEPQHYPDGISSVVGLAVTEEFFAETPQAQRDRELIKEAGFTWVRSDILWSVVETERERYNWDRYDRRISLLQPYGFKVLFILDYGNPLYASQPLTTIEGSRDKTPPDDLSTFSRYAQRVAEHFRGKVNHYEIWNEPNAWFRFWLSQRGPEPDRYVRLIQLTVPAIKEVCPECIVITGGMVYLDYPPVVPGQDRYFLAMRSADPDIFKRVDGIGFHYYTLYPPANPPEWNGGGEISLERALTRTREICSCNLPIWITETGWPTHVLSETHQANYGLRALLISLSFGVKSWLWFSVRELDPQGVVVPQEAKFALLRYDGTPKPLFLGLKRFLNLAGKATEVTDMRGTFRLHGTGNYAVRFTIPAEEPGGNPRQGIILWTHGTSPSPLPEPLRHRNAIHLVTGEAKRAQEFLPEPVWIELTD